MLPPQPLCTIPRAEEIVPLIRNTIERVRSTYDNVARTIKPSEATFERVVMPLIQVDNETHADVNLIDALFLASSDQAIHDAAGEAKQLWDQGMAAWKGRADVYELLQAVYDKDEPVDGELKRWLSRELLEYRHSGHGVLQGAEIDAFLKERAELEALAAEFQANLGAESGGLWFSDDELEGLKPEQLAQWDKAETNEGKRFIAFSNGGCETVLSHCIRPETRKQMFLANGARLKNNVPLFKKVLQIRDKQARQLGYANHMAMRMQTLVAPSGAWVGEFLGSLRDGLVPMWAKEVEKVRERRRQDVDKADEGAGILAPWDEAFYRSLLRKEAHVDLSKIEEYFPLQPTMDGLMGIFAKYFQLRFDRVPPEELGEGTIWHPDVCIFSVWDERLEQDAFLGYLYLDLLHRPIKSKGYHCLNISYVSLLPRHRCLCDLPCHVLTL